MSTILALETSCDESAVSVIALNQNRLLVKANKIASQIQEHAKWGGVVPEIASRRHLEALPFLIEEALEESATSINEIDGIAATVAPGLVGSLMVGSLTGRTLSALYELPFIGVHHLEGHLASVHLSQNPPQFPYLVLLVSGGHTELIIANSIGSYIRIGRSHDDAAGEAFDKVGRLLGLGYPGGPAIESVAVKGDPKAFKLPKGRVSNPQGGFYPYDFSFSGLKTAVLRQVESLAQSSQRLPVADIAASFENVIAEVLVERSFSCASDQNLKSLVLVGGVAANRRLRAAMKLAANANGIKLYLADKAFCTDNAAMVGAAALLRLQSKKISSPHELGVTARWPLSKADALYQLPAPF